MSSESKFSKIISVMKGVATLECGSTVDLLEIQRTLVQAFQEYGDNSFADAATNLSKITGKEFDHELNIVDQPI